MSIRANPCGLNRLAIYGLRVMIGCFAAMLILNAAPVAAQEFAGSALDANELEAYAKVQQLRRELALTNADLAAMDCTQAQAKAVMDSLLDWVKTNQTQLQQAEANVRTARSRLRQTMQKIHVGPRNPTLINEVPTLKQNYATALANRQQWYDSAANALAASMPTAQVTVWQTARTNKDGLARYRFVPNLTTEQRQSLLATLRNHTRRSDIDQVEQKILGHRQLQQLATAKANQQARMAEVIAAERAFLPESPADELGEVLPLEP